MSEVAICNSALIKLGAERINSLGDNTKNARLCNELYATLRDEMVRSHPWNFAIKRASLAPDATTPDFEFDNRFQVPGDFLRLLALYPEGDMIPYRLEGQFILANDTELLIKYIAQITDTSQFPSSFSESLSYKIAANLAYSITQSTTVVQLMEAKLEGSLRDARSFDAQENTGDRVVADSFLQARR